MIEEQRARGDFEAQSPRPFGVGRGAKEDLKSNHELECDGNLETS